MAAHRHGFVTKDSFDKPWQLKFFRNPKVKKVLVGCDVCYPKKKLGNKKIGRLVSLEE